MKQMNPIHAAASRQVFKGSIQYELLYTTRSEKNCCSD